MTSSLSKLFGSSVLKWFNRASASGRIGNRESYFHNTTGNRQKECPDSPLYTTRLAVPRDYDNVVDFMGDAYFKHEPVMVNMGLGNREPTPSLLRIMHDQVKEGMTIIAEDCDHCILGAAVNIGSCPWDPDKSVEFARCCECGPIRDVIEFFAYVTSKPDLWERYCVLKIFECSNLAVSAEFQGLGVAKKLVEESWYLARDCGYRLFRIDCTNRYSAKIAEDFGWERVCTIPFCRYVKNGDLVFKHIKEPHTAVQVYVDRVRYCKNYCLPVQKCKVTTTPKIRKQNK